MTKKAKKAYMLVMTGQGDIYITLVDKETWDWIFSDWHPPKKKTVFYEDKTVPSAILKRWRKEEEDREDSFPAICLGSYENDRALQAPPVYGEVFFSIADAIKYIGKNKLQLVDSWEGEIY